MAHTTPTLSSYLGLYCQYYDLERPTIELNELNFYKQYAQAVRSPILEPMCGTGRLLIPLLQAGYEVHGFDASPFMLEALRKKCAQEYLEPKVWQAWLQDLAINQAYDLVIIADGSFCLITAFDHILLSLQKIHAALKPGGKLVMEVQTPYFTPQEPRIWTRRVCHRSDGSIIIAHTLNIGLEDAIGTSIGRYELVDPSGALITTEFERYQVRFYEPHEIIALLHATGFKNIQLRQSYTLRNIPRDQDEFIIVESSK